MNSCETCKHYIESKDNSNIGKTIGICRRYPPQLIVMPTKMGLGISSNHPNVQPHHICGEFTSLETKQGDKDEL